MHADLVHTWIRTAALLATPIAPHFAEHIWLALLHEPQTIQRALWPDPPRPVERPAVEAGAYMRDMVKTIRDAELALLKKMSKAKSKGKAQDGPPPYDPKRPRAVRVYVATRFPEWQDACVQAVRDAWSEEHGRVDDAKVRDALAAKGLLKDKRVMPFVQLFKVRLSPVSLFTLGGWHADTDTDTQKRIAESGAETAFQRTLPFSETAVLGEILPYLKRSLNLVDAEILSVEDALAHAEKDAGYSKVIIESSEPGAPAFEFRNVDA